ncbi:hypothetical protein VTN77DRAFT_7925 [Rasamsonia byssochlamydoides]|uniref:uncharacterized protein n=1 Tax=Rasamsonia byssochlamydoides TaxID=89139 RepID=UPI00374343BC
MAIKRKQRPYYTVSEEEYRLAMKILQRFLPHEELTLEVLRDTALRMEKQDSHGPPMTLTPPDDIHETNDSPTEHQELSGCEIPTPGSSPHNSENPGLPTMTPAKDLTEQIGNLMIDSTGNMRYVGREADIVFHNAIRSVVEGASLDTKLGAYLPPMRSASLPPPSPESQSAISLSSPQPVYLSYLPPRHCCDKYVALFFEDINSRYWLFSFEHFSSRLDETYENGTEANSASWLCCLYSVFALVSGSSRICGSSLHNCHKSEILDQMDPRLSIQEDLLSSTDYLALAKSLVSRLLDEADLDSIRALSLLSLALQNESFTVGAYLYIGLAARIAYTLGLHREETYDEMNMVGRETALRVWWTLFQLDHEISRYRGRPCAIEAGDIHRRMPSEIALNTGAHIPFSYTEYSIALSHLERQATERYSKGAKNGELNHSYQQLRDVVQSLENWYNALPSYIRWDIPLAPPHRRPICELHLRYWSTMIASTRTCLLYSIIHSSDASSRTEEKEALAELGQKCIEACDQSLQILKMLHSHDLLSSLTVQNTKWIVDIAMVSILLMLREGKEESSACQQRLKNCVEMLQSMESRGWCKWASRELATVIASPNLGIERHAVLSPQMMPVNREGGLQEFPPVLSNEEAQDMFPLSMDGIIDFDEHVFPS